MGQWTPIEIPYITKSEQCFVMSERALVQKLCNPFGAKLNSSSVSQSSPILQVARTIRKKSICLGARKAFRIPSVQKTFLLGEIVGSGIPPKKGLFFGFEREKRSRFPGDGKISPTDVSPFSTQIGVGGVSGRDGDLRKQRVGTTNS